MSGLTIMIALILAPLVIVTGFFALEVLAGLIPLRHLESSPGEASAVIAVPAHDEEQVIGQTVAEICKAAPALRLLVVADNCADRTAEVARSAGAEVIVRDEPERRGKGFALAAARDHLRNNPPDVVIVIDADCQIDGASLDALVAAAAGSARPCQSVNLLRPDLKAPPLVQLSTFAFMIKNLVRQRGLQRLGGRAHLTGTGMALPWTIFGTANLGDSNIVEDLALGLELAERATPPMLVESATIWSPAASAGGTLVQRRRWEGGYLATALKVAPAAFARSLVRADVRGLCAALDLSVPPLALLAMLNAAALALALAAFLLGAAAWSAIVLFIVGLLAAAAVVLAWWREGRRFASGATLLRLPLYVLWKLPLYAGMLLKGAPKEWLRSGR